MNLMLKAALTFSSLGIPVFPLTPRQKIPLKGSNGCKDASCEPDKIISWWTETPAANIGLAMGQGLFALDFDVKGGQPGAATLKSLESQGIPMDTLNSTTQTGGFHFLYRTPVGIKIGNATGLLPGLDIRGDGGYIVAPPSVTAKGKYVWNNTGAEILDAPAFLLDLVTKKAKRKPFVSPEIIREGERDTTIFKLICSLIPRGLDPLSIREAAMKENELKCSPPLSESQVDVILENAIERYAAPVRQENLTDLGNAERLIRLHGDKIVYIPEYKKWMAWNGSRWMLDLPSGVHPLAVHTVKNMVEEALTLPDEARTALIRHSLKSEGSRALAAMIEVAAKLKGVPIQQNRLDSNQYLLNTLTGTLDLKIGIHRAANRDDFITKVAPVDYDPSATCPTWLAFLNRIMAGNEDLIAFLRRSLGYSLTGDTGEQCFFFLYGNGANGKSTYLNTVRALLGDYAMQAAAEMLMVNDRRGASNDVARLNGPRFVATSETEDNQRFAESALKQLTGQDTIAARFLYAEYFEFRPQFKIWLAANHKPIIKGDDHAIWRRIHLIPFTVTIPENEQDKHLEAKLLKELPGILNWALAGCLEWQKSGLQPPLEVQAAVKEYRNDMDQFGQWVEECCVLSPEGKAQGVKAGATDLYQSYKWWAEENTGWYMTMTRFGRTLAERGFIRVRTPKDAVWQGIGLLAGRF
jgi:putative DNA primase/helicase